MSTAKLPTRSRPDDGRFRGRRLRLVEGVCHPDPPPGVPMRTLQEWMGHRHLSTTQMYADYAPSPHEAAMVARAFERAPFRAPF